MTSHDVVAQIRRTLGIKKVGHAGTLDPMATGVLVICLGRATRLSEYAMAANKQYRANIRLGITTDTYDADGEVLATSHTKHISQCLVEQELTAFLGNIEQLPPMYSAIKQDGRKLYELARAGKTVERKPRPVTIESLTIYKWDPPQFVLDVSCGSGTYIRSLAHDLGEALGVGAHLSGLIRTGSGAMKIEHAVPLATLLDDTQWRRYILPPDYVLTHFPAIHLNEADNNHVRHGRSISADTSEETVFARAYAPSGEFVAMLKPIGDGLWRPHKVFLT